MGYASKQGRARVSARNPQAAAVCDRCGFIYNHVNLRWQYDWRGTSLQNLKLLVCSTCADVPQEQLRSLVIPADPVPIMNPRTENFDNASTNQRAVSGRVKDISGLVSNGQTVTILTSSTTPASVGSTVYVQNVVPSGYNGAFLVLSSTRTSITYASTVVDPYISGGTVSIGGVAIDPIVGIPVYENNIRTTQTGDVRVPQQTGEPPNGTNTLPGTDPNAPGDNNPGLPYGNIQVPQTGPLS